jgi:hypothetical protein
MLNGHTDDIAVRVSLLTTMTPDMLKNSSDTNIDTKKVCSVQGWFGRNSGKELDISSKKTYRKSNLAKFYELKFLPELLSHSPAIIKMAF